MQDQTKPWQFQYRQIQLTKLTADGATTWVWTSFKRCPPAAHLSRAGTACPSDVPLSPHGFTPTPQQAESPRALAAQRSPCWGTTHTHSQPWAHGEERGLTLCRERRKCTSEKRIRLGRSLVVHHLVTRGTKGFMACKQDSNVLNHLKTNAMQSFQISKWPVVLKLYSHAQI